VPAEAAATLRPFTRFITAYPTRINNNTVNTAVTFHGVRTPVFTSHQ
jgi:hypothetical protein